VDAVARVVTEVVFVVLTDAAYVSLPCDFDGQCHPVSSSWSVESGPSACRRARASRFVPEGDAGLYVQFFAKGKEIQQVSTRKSTYAESGVLRRKATEQKNSGPANRSREYSRFALRS